MTIKEAKCLCLHQLWSDCILYRYASKQILPRGELDFAQSYVIQGACFLVGYGFSHRTEFFISLCAQWHQEAAPLRALRELSGVQSVVAVLQCCRRWYGWGKLQNSPENSDQNSCLTYHSARVVGSHRSPQKTCGSLSESWETEDSEYVIPMSGKTCLFL